MNQNLIENIKNWIVLDNDIKNLQKQIKKKRKEKKVYTSELVSIMRSNEMRYSLNNKLVGKGMRLHSEVGEAPS